MSEWKLGSANKTSAYLLPTLNQDGKLFIDNFFHNSTYPQRNFVSSFGKCEEYIELKNHLFLLYKKETDNPVYQNFESRLRCLPEYSFEYDPDKYHRMYVFDIQNYDFVFKMFWSGKYSKFTSNYKDVVLKFHRLNPELFIKNSEDHKNKIVAVLFKQKWLKNDIEEKLINSPDIPKRDWVRLSDDDEYSSSPYDYMETYLNSYKVNDEGLE